MPSGDLFSRIRESAAAMVNKVWFLTTGHGTQDEDIGHI